MSTLNENQDFANRKLPLFDRVVDVVIKNRIAFIAALIVLVVGSAGYYGWALTVEQKEKAAMDVYSLGEKFYQAGVGMAESVAGQDPKSKVPQVDHSQAITHFDKVLNEYGNTKAAYLSALRLSDIYMNKNDPVKTTQVLEPIVEKSNSKDFLAAMVALRLSGVYEKQQQCDKAVPVLQKVADQKTNPVLKPEVYLRLGLCFEALNQNDKAIEVYQKITQEFSDSIQSQQAQKYLKLIKS